MEHFHFIFEFKVRRPGIVALDVQLWRNNEQFEFLGFVIVF